MSAKKTIVSPSPVYLRQDDCEQLIRTLTGVKIACSHEENQLKSIDRVLKTLKDHVRRDTKNKSGSSGTQ